MYISIWGYLGVYGVYDGIWRYMKEYEGIWQYLMVYDAIWLYMKVYLAYPFSLPFRPSPLLYPPPSPLTPSSHSLLYHLPSPLTLPISKHRFRMPQPA